MISIADKDCKLARDRWPRRSRTGRFQFELATTTDDTELCRLFRAVTMEGSVPLRFGREPSFFGALGVEGSFHQVIVCRDTHTGRAVGVAVRSIRDRYVNGQSVPIGYLSSLRFLPEFRRLGLLARGFAFLRELHSDNRTCLYLTSIATANKVAQQTLLGGRAGLPKYQPLDSYCTFVLRIPSRPRRSAAPASQNISVHPAQPWELNELVRFWNEAGSQRQFFSSCSADDFADPAVSFRGLTLDNLLVARREQAIVGTLGAWDQTAFRQMQIDRYSPLQAAIRPLHNLWAAALGRPALPPAGRPWPALLAVLPVVANGDKDVLRMLLAEQLRRVAGGPHTHFLIGLCRRDPLAQSLQCQRCVVYPTNLYLVTWDDGEPLRMSLDGRVPYLELGSL